METITPKVLTVGQLNTYIKSVLDADYHLQNIFLSGEISNFIAHRSGHFYLTLKDDKGAIKAVMFRNAASRLPFRPENGMKVLAFGRVSVYEPTGQYQFYIENMQPDGVGGLNVAFEQLKAKLEKQGLFDAAYKKPIPKYPQCIGVITSSSGAALQDIKNVISRRWPLAELLLSPTQVQGAEAAPQIVEHLMEMDRAGTDVIIVARGGGSIEDLWPFNNEAVARAVFQCQTPVVSGVGHETDYTIIDFVADCRAPTPSAAAELCVPDRFEEQEALLHLSSRMKTLLLHQAQSKRTSLDALRSRLSSSLDYSAQVKRTQLLGLDNRLHYAMKQKVTEDHNRLILCADKLDAYCPLKVISRGYSITKHVETGKVIHTVDQVLPKEMVQITVENGQLYCRVERIEKED